MRRVIFFLYTLLLLGRAYGQSSDCSTLKIAIQSPMQGFTAVVGTPLVVAVQFLDGCGNPVMAGPDPNHPLAHLLAFPSSDLNFNFQLNDQGSGLWQGLWTPASVGSSVTLTIEGGQIHGAALYVGSSAVSGAVTPPPPSLTPPILATDTPALSFSAVQGGSADSRQVQIQDTGGGSIPFMAAASSAGNWLSVSPASGTSDPSAPATVGVSAAPGSLAPGIYSGSVAISGAGATVSIPVTFVVSAPPALILLSQSQIRFSAAQNASGGISQNFTITNASSGSMAWTATADSTSSAWLSVSPASGTAAPSSQVSLFVNPSGLSAGTYQGVITIASPQATNSPQSVAVTLTVTPPSPASSPAVMVVDAATVMLSGTPGGPNVSQQFNVSNSGGASLSFVATAATSAGGSWLTLSPASGAVVSGSPAAVTVTASPASLAAGVYSGSIAVSGAGSTATIPVSFAVSSPLTAVLQTSQTGLSFTSILQGGAVLSKSFGVLNTGAGAMTWSASASTPFGGTWLQVNPSSGDVKLPSSDAGIVTVSVNAAGLTPGTYYGKVSVSSPEAVNSPEFVSVVLNVLAAGLSVGPDIYPIGLILSGAGSSAPLAQTVQLANVSGVANSYESGVIPSTGAAFSFLPPNSQLAMTSLTTLQVYPNLNQLGAGAQQRGTITLQFSDGSPAQAIEIDSIAAPASPSTSCSPLQLIYRTISSGFIAYVGQPLTIEVQVADRCGNLVGPNNPGAGKVIAFVNPDATGSSIPLTHIGNGVWQGSWTPSAPGTVAVYVTAATSQGRAITTGQTLALSGTVKAAPPGVGPTAPAPAVAAVENAASGAAGGPIAPGELISVFGANMGGDLVVNSTVPFPVNIAGTQVLVGATASPLLFASSGQVGAQVPYSVPVNTPYQLAIVNGTSLSVPLAVTVAAASPGIFAVNQQGTGQGIVLKSDGVTLAQAATPATIGETVVIYCTGLGAVTPAVNAGSPAPTAFLTYTVNQPTVTIGGQPAQVAFSGLAPGYVGLYQVNAVVPSGVAPGGTVPVTISVAGVTSNVVTMAVAGNGETSIPPTLAVDTKSISFTTTQGAAAASQTIHVQNLGGGSLSFSTSVSAPWLSVTPSSGSATASSPVALAIAATPGTLAAGSYSGTVTISAAGVSAAIAVTFTVGAAPLPPTLVVDTPSLTFTAPANSSSVANQFHVLNSGSGSLAFTVAVNSTGNWLSASPLSGTAGANSPVAVTVTATPGNMSAGTYSGSIVVSAGTTIAIPVTLVITATAANLLVSESTMTFTVTAGGTASVPRNFGILNTGVGTMDWQATPLGIANNAVAAVPWLSLTPSNGTIQRPYLDVGMVNLTVDPKTLQPGTYFGRVTINSNAAVNSPALITVVVNVLPAGAKLPPTLYPTDLIFTGEAAFSPGSQSFQIATLSATGFVTGSIGSGFGYLPLNGTVAANQPLSITVTPDLSKLAASSISRGTITLQFDDGSPAAAENILLSVAPAGSNGRTACSQPSPLQIAFRAPQANFSVSAGQPVTVQVEITDSCGNAVTSGTSGAKALAFFSNGDASVSLLYIGNGVWQATWTPVKTGTAAIVVDAVEIAGTSFVVGTSAMLAGTVN